MPIQRTIPQTLKSIMGAVLVTPGLFLLRGDLAGVVARWRHLLGTTTDDGLGILSSVILAASYSPQQLLHGVLQTLWLPLLLVVVGVVLLWNGSAAPWQSPSQGRNFS